jgi:predicted DsbA family dithiol-disulfide isomerase
MAKSGLIHRQLSGISVSATCVAVVVGLIEFELFYDYLCPFVYRAAEMLDSVRESGEREVEVTWRYFSLSQVNSRRESWTAWDAPTGELVPGRLAFAAAEAARRQSNFDVIHMALLRARHRDRLDLDDPQTVEKLAADSGLDMDRFKHDLAAPDILGALARDHEEGRGTYGVFGTPTLVFTNGSAAYVRLAQPPANGDAVRILDEIVSVAAREPAILEIKRPVRPTA